MSELYACAVRTSALLFRLSVLKERFIPPLFSVPSAYAPSCILSANFIFEVGKEKNTSLQNGAAALLLFPLDLSGKNGIGERPF